MIPKVIHYCWFGMNPKPDIILKCIDSWKQYCSEYEIIEWNESNFDINSNEYIKAAYLEKKWAFVSDYARLKIIFENGGIYLDTDVLLHESLNELLKYKCWLAADDIRYIATGLGFGAEKGNSLIYAMMKAYDEYIYSGKTNVTQDTKIVESELKEWKKSDKSQVVDGILIIGVNDYGKYARHLYTFTWADDNIQEQRLKQIQKGSTLFSKLKWKIKGVLKHPKIIAFFDKKRGTLIEKIYTFIVYDLMDMGVIYYLKRFIMKLRR